MLTHFFNTAKRIVSRSPSAQERSSETRETPPITHGPSHGIEVTMVTTRRGTETPGQDATPRGSAKRKVGKRELETLDTPTGVKRQRKSPPKEEELPEAPQPAAFEDEATQDSTEDTSDTIAVAVPTTEEPSTEGNLPIRRRSSPKVVVAKLSPPVSTETEGGEEATADEVPASTEESVYETPDQHSGSVYATPATRKKVEGSPTPRDRRHDERTSAKTSIERKAETNVEPEDNSNLEQEDNSNVEQEDNSNLEPEDNSNLEQEDNSNLEPEDNSNLEQEDNSNLEQEDNSNLKQEDNSKLEQEDNSTLEQEDNTTLEQEHNSTLKQEDNSNNITPTQCSFPDEIPSSTYGSEQAPITSQDAPLTPSQPEKAHVRFGSEEPIGIQETDTLNLQGHERHEALQTTQDENLEAAMQDDEDDASDSDEAPEVVSTITAASRAKASEQETARALLAQQEKARQKREEREKRIAEQQAEKRKREEKKAKKLAKQLAKQQSASEEPIEAPTSIDRNNLPALLPTSLLSNLPDQRAPTPPPERRGKTEEELRKEKLNHHIKFLERTEKGPKDLKKGRLSVAVLAQQNRVLPPKANRDTRNVREKWLKGRQVEVKKGKGGKGIGGKVERRAFGNRGFLVGEN